MLIFGSLAVSSQTTAETRGASSRDAKRKLVFGVKGGFNRSNVFDQKGLDFVAGPKTGAVGGVFFAIPILGFIGVQPELLLSQKGFSGSGTLNNERYDLQRTTTWLDVPLQLQLKPFAFLSLLGGVQYSYLLKQKDELSQGPSYMSQTQEFENDNIRKNIVGGVVGADVNFWHVVVSGRMGWDMFANQGDGTSNTPRYKNLWVQATIGYRFY